MTDLKQYYGLKGRPSHMLYANNVFFGPWDGSWSDDHPPLDATTSNQRVENSGGDDQQRKLIGNIFAGPQATRALQAMRTVFDKDSNNKVVDTDLSSLLTALSTYLDEKVVKQGADPRSTAQGLRNGFQNVEDIRSNICSIIQASNYGNIISSALARGVEEFPGDYSLPTHATALTGDLQHNAQLIDFCGFMQQWPILGPIGSTIFTLPCQSWCADHPTVPWSQKCSSWKKCKGCVQCKVRDPGPAHCQSWCADDPTIPWSQKCNSWKNCKGCVECR